MSEHPWHDLIVPRTIAPYLRTLQYLSEEPMSEQEPGGDTYERDQRYTQLAVHLRLLEDAVADSVYTGRSISEDDVDKVVAAAGKLLGAACRGHIMVLRFNDETLPIMDTIACFMAGLGYSSVPMGTE